MQSKELGIAFPLHQDFSLGLTADMALHNYRGGNLLPIDGPPQSRFEVSTPLDLTRAFPCQIASLDRCQPRQPILETVDQASGTLCPHSMAIESPLDDIFSLPYASGSCVEWTGFTPATETDNTNSDHHRVSKDAYHPCGHLVSHCNRRYPRLPAADYESDVLRLQERLKREGADAKAVDVIHTIFCDGVTLDALTRRRTREEAAQEAFGQGAGPVYLAFLDTVKSTQKENGVRYRCRLCPDKGEVLTWKYHRDVLRHLRKEHFGLGEKCPQWYVGSHCISSDR